MHSYNRKYKRPDHGADKASRVVTTRLTDAEWEALATVARRNGFTVETVVRRIIAELVRQEGVAE